MIVRGLNSRQWPRIRTFSILVAQLETIGFIYELCHYSRRAVLRRKDPFASNELLKIFLHRFLEGVWDFLAIGHGVSMSFTDRYSFDNGHV